MSQKTIGIVGQGFVGNALREGFSPYYQVHTYDKYIAEKSTTNLETLVNESDFIFVCVPTPMTSTGECYTGIVRI